MSVYFMQQAFIRFSKHLDKEDYKLDRLRKALDLHEERGGDLSNFIIKMNHDRRQFEIIIQAAEGDIGKTALEF